MTQSRISADDSLWIAAQWTIWFVCVLAASLARVGRAAETVEGEALSSAGCGEVAVELICHYYGREFQRDTAARILEPGSMGETSLFHVCQALRAHGFGCSLVHGTIDSLRVEKDPVVVFLRQERDDPIGHFAVALWDESHGGLTVFDPLDRLSPIYPAREEFLQYWTGDAIVVEWQPAREGGVEYLLYIIPALATLGVIGLAMQRISRCQK